MVRCCTVLLVLFCTVAWAAPDAGAVDEERALRLLAESLGRVESPRIQVAIMSGMLDGLAGRRDVPAPDAWASVAAKLSKSGSAEVRELASQLSQMFGDESATQRALKLVRQTTAKPAVRRRALHSLLTQKNSQVSALLEPLLDDDALRSDAIRGYAAIENPRAPAILLERYRKLSPVQRRAVIETLATRKPYAEALLRAIQSKQISKEDIPSHVARSLTFLLGDAFAQVFGNVRQLATDRTAQLAKYKKMITAEALANADAGRGRAVFNKTCASCHVLYGTGGKIGPDLTGSNRANLDYILLNSVDPSFDVPASYKMVIIETTDGRVLNGVIAEENAQRIVLKTVEQPQVIVLKNDIEVRSVSPKSMMPDGQLDKMKPREVVDLIKYLRTIEQVEVAK